ncbi:MAG: hypothetical protein IJT94_12195 [Oscillibacter sp.]|nr:hypothetical protein [Oscillibacter sp.]
MNRSERLDFFQNVTITLLSVSAVLLFSQTEMFRMAWKTAEESFLLASRIPSRVSTEAALSVPVRLAAAGSYGRHGDLFLTTDSPLFQSTRTLLAAAFSHSEAQWEEIPRADFLRSLDAVSLYCDFLHPLPLSLLAGLTDTVSPETREARCVAIVEESGGGTALYLWDGRETYSRRPSPVPRQELEEAVGQYRPGNASFAMDHEPEESRWRAVSPLSLLPGRTPSLPQLSATSGSAGTDALLAALRFNPLTNSRYPESNGTEVVVEGVRTVRLRANGSVYYQAAGTDERSVLSVESAGEIPTPWEAAAGCTSLLRSLLGSGGTGALYPCEVRQDENRTYLRFEYQFSGVPIRFSDGQSAAEVVLDGQSVSSLELRPRQYTAAEWESLLLPLPQALNIAAMRPGSELMVGYADDGSGQISAAWMES